MWQSVIKNIGLAPTEEYIKPRLSIGNAVSDHEFSTGHFSVQVDAQNLSLVIKNHHKRIIWKSIHNLPFLSSSLGQDTITMGDNGVFKITEKDEKPTRLQTITKIQRGEDDHTVKIYGGLGAKLVLPTHMDYVLTLKEVTHRQLQFTIDITQRDPSMNDYHRLILTYESRPDEHFYGFGEQFSHATMKGQKVPILVREQGYGRGAPASSSLKESAMTMFYGTPDRFASYASIPQYISSDIRSLFLENSEYMSFDMTEPDRVTIRLESDRMRGRILDGKTMLDILTEYTSYTGRMSPLPEWVSDGLIANISGGKEKVQEIVRRVRAEQIPLSAVFIHDWTGQRLQEASAKVSFTRQYWNWESDDDMYPNWSEFIQNDLSGTRILAYVNPFLSNPNMKSRYKRDLFTEAAMKGYLVKNALATSSENHQAYSVKFSHDLEAGLLDLTNPETRTWFKDVLKEQVWNSGISGMMVDFGEHLPCDTKQTLLHSGEPTSSYHNRYPEEWAQLNKEVMIELGKEEEALCFYRSAYTHSPGLMNLFWAGDQLVNWDINYGIKSAVTGMLTGGFSGFAVTHCDAGGSNNEVTIAGAKTIRSRELLYRWMELAACTSAFRTSEGLIPSLNTQFYSDDDTYSQLAHNVKLFTLLSAYRKTVLKEAYERGWPVLRHLVFYYPNDKIVRELTYQQFLMGNSVLIAPVLSPSTASVKVYFPKDAEKVTWRHIWSGKYFDGNGSYKAVDAPLGQPAIFIKEPRGDDGLLNPLLDYAATYYQQKLKPVTK